MPTAAARPWVANSPEQRFSIATDRFLRRGLIPPFYCTAVRDSDGGDRSLQQRVRDKNRGIQKGILDWTVVQPGVWRLLELKRGKNGLSDAQVQTVNVLTECAFPPVVAWTLRQVYEGLRGQGFRFVANVETILQHSEEMLAGWDREADGIRSGEIVKKRTPPRKPGPRYQWGKLG